MSRGPAPSDGRGVYVVADWATMTGNIDEARRGDRRYRSHSSFKFDWRRMSSWLADSVHDVVGADCGPLLGTSLIVWYATNPTDGRTRRHHKALVTSAARAYALPNVSTWLLRMQTGTLRCEHRDCGALLGPCGVCGREIHRRARKKGITSAVLAEMERIPHDYPQCDTVILGATQADYLPAVERLKARGLRVVCASVPGKAEVLLAASGLPLLNVDAASAPMLTKKSPLMTHKLDPDEWALLPYYSGVRLAERQEAPRSPKANEPLRVGVYVDHANSVHGRGGTEESRFVQWDGTSAYVSWARVGEELTERAMQALDMLDRGYRCQRVHVVRSYLPIEAAAGGLPMQDEEITAWQTLMEQEQVSVDLRPRKRGEYLLACTQCGTPLTCPSCGSDDPGRIDVAREVDVDTAVAQAMLEDVYSGAVDIVVLASSDSDFLPAVQAAQAHGARVVLACREGMTSPQLIDAADRTIQMMHLRETERIGWELSMAHGAPLRDSG